MKTVLPCSKWFFSSCPCIKDPVYHASVYYYTTQVEGITTSCMFILFLKWFLIEGFKLHWCQISLIASLFTWFMKKYLFTSTDAQFLTNAKNKLLNNNDYIFITLLETLQWNDSMCNVHMGIFVSLELMFTLWILSYKIFMLLYNVPFY